MPDIDLDEDATFSDDEGTSYDFAELLAAVQESKDIILTVPAEQVDSLKIGLSNKKSKENKKLKSAGIAVPRDAIEYIVYETAEDKSKGTMHVRVKYGPRTQVKILKMELPDDQL
jgi:hypothetical protein